MKFYLERKNEKWKQLERESNWWEKKWKIENEKKKMKMYKQCIETVLESCRMINASVNELKYEVVIVFFLLLSSS